MRVLGKRLLAGRFFKCHRGAIAIVLLGSAGFFSMAGTRTMKPASAHVPSMRSIPRDHYQTWSLFLVCNPKWLASEKSSDLDRLYEDFQNFGRTIGENNLAVWFWKSDKTIYDSHLAKSVDVERSIKFCKSFKLAPSAGPHLLVVSSYPDLTTAPRAYADYALGSKWSKEISDLLAKLTDELLLQGKVMSQPAVAAPSQDRLWIRLLEATQRSVIGFGCAWTFKVNAGALAVDLRPCQKSQ